MSEAVRRVLTGMRTTGALHLGHYVGALTLWLEAQKDPNLECFFLLADLQALTTHADRPELIRDSVRQVTLDWMAVGLEYWKPNVNFVLQSQVPARGMLFHLLSNVVRWSEVERNPTIKEELKSVGGNPSAGFMVYVVDQAADIYMVSPPNKSGNQLLVPVGADQLPHLNDARMWARRFNRDYAPVFRPCEGQVGKVGRLVGTDGDSKMSKSLGNAIMLSDTPEVVTEKVMGMFTDPNRIHRTSPGDPENNPVFTYLDAFDPDPEQIQEFKSIYRAGEINGVSIGDVELKRRLASVLNDFLNPIREKRHEVVRYDLGGILQKGTARANGIANEVLDRAMEAMHLGFKGVNKQ